MKIDFSKYQGTGNDFVMIDNRDGVLSGEENELFAQMCHRRFGIGADGVILLNKHQKYPFYMDYFNSDGRRSTMCGNGGRCITRFASDLGLIDREVEFLAIDGAHRARVSKDVIALKMIEPADLGAIGMNQWFVFTGSPHVVVREPMPVDQLDIVTAGKKIRYSDLFAEEGVNVNFFYHDGKLAHVRTYERGVEDETWSCGTGVTAVATIWKEIIEPDAKEVKMKTPGGELKIFWEDADPEPWLEGAAEYVFSGIYG